MTAWWTRGLAPLGLGLLSLALLLGGGALAVGEEDQGSDSRDEATGSSMSESSMSGGAPSEDKGSGTRAERPEQPDAAPPTRSARSSGKSGPLERTPVDPELTAQVAQSAAQIDRLVLEKLKAERIRPNPQTNGLQFVRRAYLDITGTIPTAREANAYLQQSRRSGKRAALIDQLLNSEGHVSHSFNFWADLLRLQDMPSNDNYGLPYLEWVKQVLASDLPYDQFVYQLLTAEGRVWENPAVGYTLRDLGMPLSNLDNTARVFLGTRVGCAQCHDHPFDRWTQKEFYQLAAFVHGTETSTNRQAIRRAVSAARRELQKLPKSNENDRLMGQMNQLVRFNQYSVGENDRPLELPHDYQYEDAKPGDVVQPQVLFGALPEGSPGDSKRAVFARWLTSPENPRFTLTIANRLWQRVFGVGLIEPVDDLTDTSAPTNGPLMDFLVAELKRVNYRQREFLRILYNTKAYQREAYRQELVAGEPYHFPGPILRRMTAEQLWDSLLTLTLVEPSAFQRPSSDGYIHQVAINPGDQLTLEELEEKVRLRRSARRRGEEAVLRRKFTHEGLLLVRASEMPMPVPPDHFLRQFGQSDRQLISGGSTEGHVPQILTMFNGQISHKLLHEGTVIYDQVMDAEDLRAQIDGVFMSLLCRKPSRSDRKLATAEIQAYGAAGFGNVIWALLNTREFLFIQ